MKKLMILMSVIFTFALLAPAVSAQEKEDFEVKETEAKAAQADMAKISAMDAKKLAAGEAKQGKKKGKKEKANEYFAFCQYFVDRFRASESVQALCAELGVKVPGKPAGAASLGDMEYQALVDAAKKAQAKADELYAKYLQEEALAAEAKKEGDYIQAKIDVAEEVGTKNVDEAEKALADTKKKLKYDELEAKGKAAEEEITDNFKKEKEKEYAEIDNLRKLADEYEKNGEMEKAKETRNVAQQKEDELNKDLQGRLEKNGDYSSWQKVYKESIAPLEDKLKGLYDKGGMNSTQVAEAKDQRDKKWNEANSWSEQAGETYKEHEQAKKDAEAAWAAVDAYESGMSGGSSGSEVGGGSSGGSETPAVEEPKKCSDVCKNTYPDDQESYEKCLKECK